MTIRPGDQLAPFVEPKELAAGVLGFADDDAHRVLLLTGVSGVGKSTLLRQLAGQRDDLLYIDVSAAATPLGLLQAIYAHLEPEADLVRTLRAEMGDLFSVYLTDVGTVSVIDSTLDGSPIENQVTIELSPEGELFYLAARGLVTQSLDERPVTIALDQFEEAVDNRDVRSLLRQLLEACPRLSLILASKRALDADRIADQGVVELVAQGLSADETSELLTLRGAEGEALSAAAFSLCQGHPLFLTILADALDQGLTVDEGLLTATRDEGLRLLVKHISDKLPHDLQKAFYYLPLCRVFTLPLVRSALQLDSFDAKRLVAELCDRLYAQRVDGKGLFRFHELLTNLQRREIPAEEQHTFDRAVVDFYRGAREEAGRFRAPHELIEPFYHLQHLSSREAFDYFEEHYKPILDRKERGLAGVLVGQIRLELHGDPVSRNWFELRKGGYYREFGDFARALEIFERILETPELDRRLTAYTLNNAAICQMFSGRLHEALDRFSESSRLCDELDLPTVKAHNFSNLGILWGRLGQPAKAREALENAVSLYKAEGVEGLFVGKVLQNYSALLLGRNRAERATDASLSAERAYLRDNDLVGGILSRLRACTALSVQSAYGDAAQLLEPLYERFDQILSACYLPEVRVELAHYVGMMRLYRGRTDEALAPLLEALAHSLDTNTELHVMVTNMIRTACVAAAEPDHLARLVAAVERDPRFPDPVAPKMTTFLADPLAASWLIRDAKGVHHAPGCAAYKTGHYLLQLSLVARADLLTRKELRVCRCVSAAAPPAARPV